MRPDPVRLEQARAAYSDVSRETVERLVAYSDLFEAWNRRINLASGSTMSDFWSRHVCDSLQLCKIGEPFARWVDLGSGGGLPGLVIGCVAKDVGGTVHCVESNRKKAAFLTQTAAKLALPIRVHACRIEEAEQRVGSVDYVTARALAPLRDLLALAEPWLTAGAVGLFPKGRAFQDEIEAAQNHFSFDLTAHPSQTSADGVILEIQNLQRL